MELKEIQSSVEKLTETWHDFQAIHTKSLKEQEKNGFVSSLTNISLSNVQDEMDKIEKKVSKMQAKMDRPPVSGKEEWSDEAKEQNNLINIYCRKGIDHMTPDEVKGLSVSDSELGGFLVPEIREQELLKSITEFSPIRQIARVRQTSADALVINKRTGQFAATWVGELAARSETVGYTVGQEKIPVHELHAMVPISHQLMEDSATDIEAEINEEMREQFVVAEATAFVVGDSVGKPEGFQVNAALQAAAVANGHATVLDPDGLIDLFYDVKEGYSRNGTWVMNRSTIRTVRKFKAEDDQYLWQPGLAGLAPATILDRPYVEATDMPAVGSGTFPIGFGDFRAGYSVVDRIGLAIERIKDSTTMNEGGIRIYGRMRVGGQVVLAEAIRLLEMTT